MLPLSMGGELYQPGENTAW